MSNGDLENGTKIEFDFDPSTNKGHADIPDIPVALKRSRIKETRDQLLWVVIRNRAKAISFDCYSQFVNHVMCEHPDDAKGMKKSIFPRVDSYDLLKAASELFLMTECGVFMDQLLGSTKLYDPQEEVGRGIKAPHGSIEEVMKGLRDNYLEFLEKDTEKNLKVLPYFKTIRTRLNELPLKRVEVVCGGIFRGMNANEQKILEGAMEGVCYGILPSQIFCPCLLELIWSYWHEEGMLVQTMNTISLRFQNRPAGRNSLAELDIDPLRPINSILWGYISDEQHRLTLARRCYEYDHHYGLRLEGIAVPQTRGVDSRSKFLEAFHNLLSLTTAFYKQDDNITVVADGFPLLNALKDVHLLLAQGMHNQYGDLPWNARMEMLMQQWILARPEMRDFLRGRVMVPYPEAWMDRVDAMKGLQGWTDSTVIHFRDLGVYGEQILLSIRFGNWMKVDDADSAANWARYWRSEIKGYIHAYRAVTGVDLTTEGSDPRQANLRNMSPAIHLRNRQAAQSRNS